MILEGGPDCWDRSAIIRARVRVWGEVGVLVLGTDAAVLVRLQAGVSELLNYDALSKRLEGDDIPGTRLLVVRLFDLEPGAEYPSSCLPINKVLH